SRSASRSAPGRPPRARAVRRREPVAVGCTPGGKRCPSMNKITVALIVSLMAVSAAASTDRDDVAAVARAFYRSYAGGDLEGALSLWSPQSPAADLTRRRVR